MTDKILPARVGSGMNGWMDGALTSLGLGMAQNLKCIAALGLPLIKLFPLWISASFFLCRRAARLGEKIHTCRARTLVVVVSISTLVGVCILRTTTRRVVYPIRESKYLTAYAYMLLFVLLL